MVLNCTAASTSNSRITFKWKHDNVDVKKEFVETVLNRKPKNPQQRRTNRARREIGDSASLPMGPAGLKYDRYASDEDSDDGDDTDGDDNERNDEQPDHQIPLPPNSTVAVSHVTLANVDHQHSGRYQCIATNRFGTTYSQKFKVTVACKLMEKQRQPCGREIYNLIYIFHHILQRIRNSQSNRTM